MSEVQATKKKENYVLRSFCALIIFCIIFVHYEPCYQLFGMNAYEFVEGVGRFAIPMFFMISGYFLYSSDGHTEKDLKRKTLRILYLLVFMKVLYFLLDCVYYSAGVISYRDLVDGLLIMNWSSKQIWFIYFLFFVYLFHWLLYRKGIDYKYAMMVGVVFLAIELFSADFCAWASIPEIFGIDMHAVGQVFYCFIAFFFFPLGYYLHKNRERTDQWNGYLLFLILIVGAALSVAEVIYYTPVTGVSYSSLYFGSVIITVPFFLLTFRVPEGRLRCRPLEFMGRMLLPWMYAFYMAIMFFLKFVLLKGINASQQLVDLLGLTLSVVLDVILAFGMYLFLNRMVSKRVAATS